MYEDAIGICEHTLRIGRCSSVGKASRLRAEQTGARMSVGTLLSHPGAHTANAQIGNGIAFQWYEAYFGPFNFIDSQGRDSVDLHFYALPRLHRNYKTNFLFTYFFYLYKAN